MFAAVREAKAQRKTIFKAVRQAMAKEEELLSPEKLTREGVREFLGKRKRASAGSHDGSGSDDAEETNEEGGADVNLGEAETGVETPVENDAEKEEEEEEEDGSEKSVSSQRLQWDMGKWGSGGVRGWGSVGVKLRFTHLHLVKSAFQILSSSITEIFLCSDLPCEMCFSNIFVIDDETIFVQ